LRRQAKASFAGSSIGIGLLLVGLLSLLLVSTASAEPATPTYAYAGAFGGSGSGNGEFNVPAHLAVEPGTGNVLVADTRNDRVQVFAPDAGAIGTYLTTIETGAASAPFGIAIDQGTGAVYVSLGGDNEIVRFTSDGAPVPTYTEDASFANPAEGSGPAENPNFVTASALAVDPTNHDLLVADPTTNVVSRYTAAGIFVSSFDGSDTPTGAFTGLLDIAAGANGTTYVVDGSGELVYSGAPSRVERFDGSGISQGALELDDKRGPVRATPRAVAVDPSSGRVVVAGRSWLYPGDIEPRLYVFSPTGTEAIAELDYPEQAHRGVVIGVAIDGSGTHRLYSSVQKLFEVDGADAVYGFDPAVIPGVEIKPAGELTATSAKLNGSVDPGGSATTAYFEYSADEGASWTPTDLQDMGEGTGEQAISAAIADLAPNTAYLVRLQASNAFGQSKTSANQSFSTEVAPPSATTDGASDITATSATLNGRVNPFGLLTTYHFEYGTTDQYGSRTPASEAPAGNGRVQRSFSQPLSGLQPGATYHYRIVATSPAGTTKGADRTFTSVGTEEVKRAFEQVSPVDKSGNFISYPRTMPQAGLDGNSVVYGTSGAFEGDSAAGPLVPRYLAVRGPDGWSHRHLDVPQLSPVPTLPPPGLSRTVLAVSDDLSHSIVISNKALTSGAIEGGSNLYLLDNASGGYELIGATANTSLYIEWAYVNDANDFLIGGTPDFSTVAFVSGAALTPDGEDGLKSAYVWSDGILSLATQDGNGQSLGAGVPAFAYGVRVPNAVSEDGARIYFTTRQGEYSGLGVYLRSGGVPVPISVSHRAGDDPSVVVPASFRGATPDGRYAFFKTGDNTPPLTEDASAGTGNMYRYDAVTDELEFLGSGFEQVLGKSSEGSYAYLLTIADVDGNAEIVVWHDGSLQQVGPIRNVAAWEVSPNGRYLTFTESIEGLEFVSFKGLVFLYDAQSDSLSCASCAPDGGTAGGVMEGISTPIYGSHWPRAVTDDGAVFYSTEQSLVADDVNGVADVYEYRAGQPHLVSAGIGSSPSYFVEASPDGRDVFFTTANRLVPQDDDDLTDLYDARVGGGIAAQQVKGQSQGFVGGACQVAGAMPPPPPVGSEGVNGPGNPHPRKKARCGKGRHRVTTKGKSRCVRKQHRQNGNRRQGR